MEFASQIDPSPKREVIAAGHLPLEAAEFMRGEIGRNPWRGRITVSYAQVRRLDEFGEPFEVRETWAPERLASPEEFAECDDEEILEAIFKRHGTTARAVRAVECVSLRLPSKDEARLLRSDRRTRVFSVSRLFRSFGQELILAQRLLATQDCLFTYNGNIAWEHALGATLRPRVERPETKT